MARWTLSGIVLGLLCLPASAQLQRAFGWCEQGGQRAVVNGIQSSNYVQQSYAACTVTVYNGGTTNLATVFTDSGGTISLANPFTATSNGFWAFYGANGTYDVQFSGAGITSPFSVAGYQLGSSGGGGTVGPGSTTFLARFNTTTTIGNSQCQDNGVNPMGCALGLSVEGNALYMSKLRNGSTGTTANLLVAFDSAGKAINAQPTDTNNVKGIAFTSGTAGGVDIAYSGSFPCQFDNQTSIGDWVVLGSSSQCHDAGASQPTGVEDIGRVNSVNSGVGTLAGVDLGLPDTTNSSSGGGTGVVSTVVCTGPLGTYTAPGSTITGDCATSDDGAGNVSAKSFTVTGPTAGFLAFGQGSNPVLGAVNTAYIYAPASVSTSFGTSLPASPGSMGQALVVTSVTDATHIGLGYSSSTCAEGICIQTAPVADQTLVGGHALTNNAGDIVADDGGALVAADSANTTATGTISTDSTGQSSFFYTNGAINANIHFSPTTGAVILNPKSGGGADDGGHGIVVNNAGIYIAGEFSDGNSLNLTEGGALIQGGGLSSGNPVIALGSSGVEGVIGSVPQSGGGTYAIHFPNTGLTNSASLPNGSGTLSMATVYNCTTTTACAKTNLVNPIILRGDVTFPTATTVTLTALPFTSAASYSCTASDLTSAAGIVNATTYTDGTSVTFTETGGTTADHARYICVGN